MFWSIFIFQVFCDRVKFIKERRYFMYTPYTKRYVVTRYNDSNVFSIMYRKYNTSKAGIRFIEKDRERHLYGITIGEKQLCFDKKLNAITCEDASVVYGPDIYFFIKPESFAYKLCTELKTAENNSPKNYCLSYTGIMNTPGSRDSFMDLALFKEIKNVVGQRFGFVSAEREDYKQAQ